MSIPRLFTDAPLFPGAEIPAEEGQAAYLGRVLRRRPGDALRLFNGRDGEWEGRILSLLRDQAVLRAERRLSPQRAVPAITLLLALLKREAMEAAVQAATELGAARILPVMAERSVPDRVNRPRLQAIAREAAEQCERMDLPVIGDPLPLPAALAGWSEGVLFLAAERGAAPSLLAAATGARPPFGLLIGPEGGFAPAELDAARARPFVVPATLGPRILRARTAVAAGLAVLMAAAGDWNPSQG